MRVLCTRLKTTRNFSRPPSTLPALFPPWGVVPCWPAALGVVPVWWVGGCWWVGSVPVPAQTRPYPALYPLPSLLAQLRSAASPLRSAPPSGGCCWC